MAYLGITTYHWIYYGAFPETFHLARQLRRTITPAEKNLWSALRNRILGGYKFRRQHPVREFVVDFFCPERELVIEIDGGIHQKKSVKERDENRTAELERMGLRVIRFTNEEVMNDIEEVLKKIEEALISPSPPGEGAGG
jgi:very-short-patch-repair endonuclease